MSKFKVLIDTDIGDDIDDALAISLALKMQDKMELIGVTTTYMDTVFRAKIVKSFLSAFSCDAPVYAGYGETLGGFNFHPLDIKSVYDGLYKDLPVSNSPEDAIDFIIDSCYKYKKELTIIAIGPFTNIAKVIQKDANALKQVDKIVIMGGAYFKQYADWNVFCDPVSAKILFDNCDNILAVGADVTHKLAVSDNLTSALVNYDGNDNGIKLLSAHAKAWQEAGERAYGNKPKLILHDPLAVYSAIDKSFIETEKTSVAVATDGMMAGFTLNLKAYSKAGLNPNCKGTTFDGVTVAKEVKSQDFINEYFNIILK